MRHNWVWIAMIGVTVAFLAGEMIRGYKADGITFGGENRWENLMQYTTHWRALPPDYESPFREHEARP